MLTVFLLVSLFRRYGTSAAPIIGSHPSIHDVSIFSRDEANDSDSGRTVWDILWSCLATTFAVTWVSVHPNVSFCEETNRMVLKRRMFLMMLALLAPEVMIMWAFKQWRGAVMIKEIINRARPEPCMSRSCGIDNVFDVDRVTAQRWTTKHGYFLQMGGFKLACSQEEAYVGDMRYWRSWRAFRQDYAY